MHSEVHRLKSRFLKPKVWRMRMRLVFWGGIFSQLLITGSKKYGLNMQTHWFLQETHLTKHWQENLLVMMSDKQRR